MLPDVSLVLLLSVLGFGTATAEWIAIEANDPSIVYDKVSEWYQRQDSCNLEFRSTIHGASASLTFSGNGFRVHGSRGPTGGVSDIFIDSELAGSFDRRSFDPLCGLQYERSDLIDAQHTLRIVFRGSDTEGSDGGFMSITRIEYSNSTTVTIGGSPKRTILGGVVGGIAGLAIFTLLIGLTVFLRRRRDLDHFRLSRRPPATDDGFVTTSTDAAKHGSTGRSNDLESALPMESSRRKETSAPAQSQAKDSRSQQLPVGTSLPRKNATLPTETNTSPKGKSQEEAADTSDPVESSAPQPVPESEVRKISEAPQDHSSHVPKP
ncbi:hypothetical protein FRC03_004125 [Tulasnella sp. 419]|nr:hypothetical protein FRC02_007222 [Tulasnella sp. 418]KAG8969172.1 hypothetical protein FRC03_004125 [Tulasnella sp. 419]